MHTLTEVPDYYSEQYHYQRYPAKVAGRPGHFAVWSRDVERPNPNHVTWSPALIAIVAEEYQTEAWHAERAEKAARPDLAVGDTVRLGDLVVEVAKRCAEYVDSVPCSVVPLYTASPWDFAFTVVRPDGVVAPGPQYDTLAKAQAEADRLNEVLLGITPPERERDYDPERDDFEDEVDTPDDYEGDKYLGGDPEPRTRTAAEIADHAGILQEDAQQLAGLIRHTSGGSTIDDLARVADLVERLAAQVEDLAAQVARTA